MGFASNEAPGYDNVPMTVVQHSIDIISRPLAHIINLCVSPSIVPDEIKIAQAIPLSRKQYFQIIDWFLFFHFSLSL